MYVLTRAKRTEVMSRINARGIKATELRLIEIFRKHRITGWRRRQKLFGSPDFVFRAARLCVFVDGCFWHGCPKCYRRPESNRKFWEKKVQRNRARDRLVSRTLRAEGWRVVRVWECCLKPRNRERVARRVRGALLAYTRTE